MHKTLFRRVLESGPFLAKTTAPTNIGGLRWGGGMNQRSLKKSAKKWGKTHIFFGGGKPRKNEQNLTKKSANITKIQELPKNIEKFTKTTTHI